MKISHWLLLMVSLLLIGCSEVDYSDLDEFIKSSGHGLRGQVDPVPGVKPHKHFTYSAFEISSPFIPRQNELVKNEDSGLQPDLERRREALENFALESLKMVGSLQQNEKVFALINSPDGILHRVSIGNYLGKDFGQIAGISESEIILKEIVQDSVDDWSERVSSLMLEGQE